MKVKIDVIHEHPDGHNGKIKSKHVTHDMEFSEAMSAGLKVPIDAYDKHKVIVRLSIPPTDANIAVQELFSEHSALAELFKNEVTVYAWFKQAMAGHCTVEEALVGAVVHLAQEKQKYFDELIEAKMKEAR